MPEGAETINKPDAERCGNDEEADTGGDAW